MNTPLTTNDGVVLGILVLVLAFVFETARSKSEGFRRFYSVVPPLLICYFAPSLLTTLGVYDPDASHLYFVASRYLLPASLVLLTVSTDLKEILRLGPKAVAVFLAGTVGVVLGGPLSLWVMQGFFPEAISGFGDEGVWRGMSTVAGSWIGGGANQAAMKEVFVVSDEMFSAMITVDVLVANVWMAILLYGVPRSEQIDRWNRADASLISSMKAKFAQRHEGKSRPAEVADLFLLLAVGFGVTAVAHFGADALAPLIEERAPGLARFSLTSSFFWLVVIATAGGVLLSFTRLNQLESVGASKVGTVFLYVLIASIGMKMDVLAIFRHSGLFLMGMIWMMVHAVVLIAVGRLVRAPFFLIAVGSQANIGGAASAPVVAGAFHSSLAPVGVLLAVFGYGVGTYAAYLCAQIMRVSSGG